MCSRVSAREFVYWIFVICVQDKSNLSKNILFCVLVVFFLNEKVFHTKFTHFLFSFFVVRDESSLG